MFGKAASRDADIDERIDTLINRIVEQEGIKTELMVLSGESQVGVGGANLSVPERHTIALGRALMKRPDVLVFYDALSPFEERAKCRLLAQIRTLLPELTLIWIDKAMGFSDLFDRVYHFSEKEGVELADSQNT